MSNGWGIFRRTPDMQILVDIILYDAKECNLAGRRFSPSTTGYPTMPMAVNDERSVCDLPYIISMCDT